MALLHHVFGFGGNEKQTPFHEVHLLFADEASPLPRRDQLHFGVLMGMGKGGALLPFTSLPKKSLPVL